MSPNPRGGNLAWSIQPKCKVHVMMTKEGSTKTVYIMIPGAGVLVQGCGHISHKVKCIISLKFFFSTLRNRTDKLSI